ncbi:MAG: toll/interleukin-1 receptor domain-containing protein [Candidatus Bathyarchaeota archaeon]|nr:toll/interleukin-1 receptor domain-containing protein [Candidatus Bathyarchaeota archaeon]
MAVVELDRRRARTVQVTRLTRRSPPQIFVAHTALSKALLARVESVITKENVRPVIADQEPSKTNLAERITRAIGASDALFVVLTKNALRKPSTRDWILFEVGAARAMWKNLTSKVTKQYALFAWKDVKIKLPSDSPITQLAEYRPLNTRSNRSKDAMLDEMQSIARNISLVRKL